MNEHNKLSAYPDKELIKELEKRGYDVFKWDEEILKWDEEILKWDEEILKWDEEKSQ